MIIRLVLLFFFSSLPAFAQEVLFVPFEGSESPNGRYAIAWGLKYGVLDLSNPDELLANVDIDLVENYLVDLEREEILATFPSSHFAFGDSIKNRSYLEASWRDDSRAVLVVEDGRWGYETISVVYVVEPEHPWYQCSDAIPLAQSFNRLFRDQLGQRHSGQEEEIDDLVFSVVPKGWQGDYSMQVQAYGDLPKQESRIDFDEVMTVSLPRPQLVTLPGDEAGESDASEDPLLITPNSVGPVEIGMTVADVRSALPNAKFSRTYDGEGIALILVEQDGEYLMNLFAGEWDPDAPIDETANIEMIDVLSKDFKTAKGVRVGMSVEALEGVHGRIEEIMMSEIESREYAEFDGLSSGISYQLSHEENTAGRYSGGEMVTTRYRDGAFLYAIQVMGASVVLDGSIGGIQLDDEADRIWVAAGRHSWGQVAQGKDEMWEAFGQAVQPWAFPAAGIEFDMISDDIGGPKTVYSMTMRAPATLRTGRDVGIGSTRAEVEAAYSDYLPDPEGFDGYFDGQDVHLVGSIYGGMLFTFENGLVSEIFLGAMAE